MVKNCPLVATILTLVLTACGITVGHADRIDFVQFNGIQYLAVGGYIGGYFRGADARDVVEADLGPEFAKVEYKHDEPHVFSHGCCRDGDAAYLDKGTAVYIVKGYNPEFRLAAYRDDRLVLYEADTNPKAQTGADLLDIGGKVEYIGVNSAEDGVTELASITDPEQVAVLVESVLGAPVDQTRLPQGGVQVYFIAFHLRDGTIVTRGFLPDSGELSRGIMLPEAFGIAVEQALSAATPTPHPISSPIPATATEIPVPTLDYNQTATAVVQAVVSTVQPRVHASLPSPDRKWRVEIIIYDCTQVTEDGPNAYEQLKLIRVGDGTESVIATQLQYCGGLGVYGLGGLYWSPNSRYFYYTDAREGSPDGLCWYWQPSIYHVDVLTQETQFTGEGPLSPDQTKIAMWRDGDLLIWGLDEGELARIAAAFPDAKRGPISWSPDSQSFVYLQTESDCFPFGKSYLIRVDVFKGGQSLLLESEPISFIHVHWETSDRISLSDEQSNQWIYDLVYSKLEPVP